MCCATLMKQSSVGVGKGAEPEPGSSSSLVVAHASMVLSHRKKFDVARGGRMAVR